MQKWKKYALTMMGAALLCLTGKTTVLAQEQPAPFTAEELMGAVNAQCANLTSLKETLAESMQMVEPQSGMELDASVVMELEQSRTAAHTTMGIAMSAMGMTEESSMEVYTTIVGTTLYTYTRSEAGSWYVEERELSAEELAENEKAFLLSGIDTKSATVALDGNIIRLYSVVEAESMEEFADMLSSSGLSVNNAFPVVLEIDGATLLPVSMLVEMKDMLIDSMEGLQATVHASVIFSGYNQYDDLAVPAEVVANAA